MNNFLVAIANSIGWIAESIRDAIVGTARFAARHWGIITAVLLALAIAAAVTLSLIFFFPGGVAALAALSFTLPFALPFLGSVIAPFALLSGVGGALVIGAFTFVATLAATAVLHAGAGIYNFLNRFFTPANDLYEQNYNQMVGLVESKIGKDHFERNGFPDPDDFKRAFKSRVMNENETEENEELERVDDEEESEKSCALFRRKQNNNSIENDVSEKKQASCFGLFSSKSKNLLDEESDNDEDNDSDDENENGPSCSNKNRYKSID